MYSGSAALPARARAQSVKFWPKRFEVSGHLFRVFRVILLRVIWWILLLAYNKKTIHEGTRTITKKHEQESLRNSDVGLGLILLKDLSSLTLPLPEIIRLISALIRNSRILLGRS